MSGLTAKQRKEIRDEAEAGIAYAKQEGIVVSRRDVHLLALFDALIAAESRMDVAEAALASLADTVNQELRESGEFSQQAELGQDLRPFVRLLVDVNRVRGG